LKKKSDEKVSKNVITVQKTWFDANAHDEWIINTWNRANDNLIQEQCQWEKSWSICKKWDDDHNNYVL